MISFSDLLILTLDARVATWVLRELTIRMHRPRDQLLITDSKVCFVITTRECDDYIFRIRCNRFEKTPEREKCDYILRRELFFSRGWRTRKRDYESNWLEGESMKSQRNGVFGHAPIEQLAIKPSFLTLSFPAIHQDNKDERPSPPLLQSLS